MKNRKNVLKVVGAVLVLGMGLFLYSRAKTANNSKVSYQTTQVEKGTLIVSVSASGNVSNSNIANVYTSLSGVVKKLYVKNGDTVVQGQKIAELELDETSKQKQSEAWASYLSALISSNSAEQSRISSEIQTQKDDIAVIQAEQDMEDGFENQRDEQIKRATLEQVKATRNLNLRKYTDTQKNVDLAKLQLSLAWNDYLQASSVITAPTNGTIASLAIAEGSYINQSATSSSSNSSSTTLTKIGLIKIPNTGIKTVVNLSEVDVIKVKNDQKVTITADAFPDKTFTGKVLSVDITGQISSGVTTYPTTISFDESPENIYPNMGVTAKIITTVKDSAVLIPSSAVKTSSDGYYVELSKNGQISQVSVEVGESNDTQTEIISGLNEGDTVVTGTTTSGSSTSQNTSSPFGNNRNFGGGNVRTIGR